MKKYSHSQTAASANVTPSPAHSKHGLDATALIVAAIIFAAALGWSLLDYEAAVRMKAYTGFFAYGRSVFQLYFYLGFMILACTLQAYRPLRRYRAVPLPAVRTLLAGMVLCSLYAFSRYAEALSLPWSQRIILYADGNVSSNSLQNIHVLKSALVVIAGWAGLPTSITSADNGAAYLQVLPGFIPIVGALVLLLAGALLLFNLGSSVPEEPDGPPVSIGLIRAAVTFIWLKDFIDGGFVSPESIFAGVYLAQFDSRSPSDQIFGGMTSALAYGFGICIFVIGALRLVLGPSFEPFAALPAWGTDLVGAAAAVCLVAACSDFLANRGLFPAVYTAMLAGLLILLRSSNPWWAEDYQNLFRPIPRGTYFTAMLPHSVTGSTWKAETPYFYFERALATRDFLPLELYEKFRLRPGIPYVSTEGVHCKQGLRASVSAEVRILKGSVDPSKLANPTVGDFQEVMCKNGEWCTMRIYARLSPCVPLPPALSEPVITALAAAGARVFGYRNESIWGRVSTDGDDH